MRRYEPGFLEQKALKLGYNVTAKQSVDAMLHAHDVQRAAEYDLTAYDDELAEGLMKAEGEESGGNVGLVPLPPFPIHFASKFAAEMATSDGISDYVSYQLLTVPDDVMVRHDGRFASWVKPQLEKSISSDWLPAIVSFCSERHKVSQRKAVTLTCFEKLTDSDLPSNTKAEILLMAFLRHNNSTSTSEAPKPLANDTGAVNTEDGDQIVTDITITEAILSLPSFDPETSLEALQSAKVERNFTENMADLRMSGQRIFDRIPAHRLGVRTEGGKLRDAMVGRGGICVRR